MSAFIEKKGALVDFRTATKILRGRQLRKGARLTLTTPLTFVATRAKEYGLMDIFEHDYR